MPFMVFLNKIYKQIYHCKVANISAYHKICIYPQKLHHKCFTLQNVTDNFPCVQMEQVLSHEDRRSVVEELGQYSKNK